MKNGQNLDSAAAWNNLHSQFTHPQAVWERWSCSHLRPAHKRASAWEPRFKTGENLLTLGQSSTFPAPSLVTRRYFVKNRRVIGELKEQACNVEISINNRIHLIFVLND